MRSSSGLTRRAVMTGAVGLGVAACGGTGQEGAPAGSRTPSPTSTTTTPPPPPQLPGGGRTVFPSRRLFGYSGSPVSPALGRMGIGDLDQRAAEMVRRSAAFAGGRKVLPVVELIATLVHPVPGADGMYRTRVDEATIEKYLAAARSIDGILLLNIQPGRARFLDECRAYEKYLVQPDVGVALDPEWAVKAGQVPGRVFGSTTGEALDECAAYLADLVRRHRLPEKVMVYHQLHLSIVAQESRLRTHPGVVLVKSIDGIGAQKDKVEAYRQIVAQTPKHVHLGFKLFFEEDARHGPLMTPQAVLGLTPQPEYVLYE